MEKKINSERRPSAWDKVSLGKKKPKESSRHSSKCWNAFISTAEPRQAFQTCSNVQACYSENTLDGILKCCSNVGNFTTSCLEVSFFDLQTHKHYFFYQLRVKGVQTLSGPEGSPCGKAVFWDSILGVPPSCPWRKTWDRATLGSWLPDADLCGRLLHTL